MNTKYFQQHPNTLNCLLTLAQELYKSEKWCLVIVFSVRFPYLDKTYFGTHFPLQTKNI